MKTNLFRLFLLAFLATMIPQLASAYDFKINGLCYNKNSNGKSVTVTYQNQTYDNTTSPSYPSLTGAVTIPANVTYGGITYAVTSVGNRAFYRCTGMTSVTIPSSVTTIGYRAFAYCSGLTSVTIPNSVTSIDFSAFERCSKVASLTLGSSVTTIGSSAFAGCSNLTSVNIPGSVTKLGYMAFSGCSRLTSVTIPSSVTKIEYGTFAQCSSLTSLTIPSSVTAIGSGWDSSNGAFSGCIQLTSIFIPSSVTTIGDYAFFNCRGLTALPLPNSVTTIGQKVFANCTGFTSLNFPSSLKSIGYGAFYGCSGLTSVTIPSTVTSIGYNPFLNCNNITSIAVSGENTKYDSRENCNAIIETASSTLVAGCINTTIPASVTALGNWSLAYIGMTSITIPSLVKSIGDYAFNGCLQLASVTIPNGLTNIGIRTFANCRNLTSITIPNSVRVINEEAFLDCRALTSVVIPCSVNSFGNDAFYNCEVLTSLTVTGNGAWDYKNNMPKISQLKTVNIGSGITSLGNFGLNPDVVNCYATVPPTCQSGTFSTYNGALHVPYDALSSYFTANYWKNFNNINNNLTEKVVISQSQAIVPQEGLTLSATTTPEGRNVLWSTSNPAIATVNTDGLVYGLSQGKCDIFATLESNPAVYASCLVNTSNPDIELSLNHSQIEMKYGEEKTLVATITPSNLGLTPYWHSSNNSVATVNNGVVTAMGEGECDITAKVLNKTATCHVVVDSVSISLNYDEIVMHFGEVMNLVATIDPDNAGLIPTWTSSNTSVATVESGMVTAVGEGECLITAKVLNKTATCHVIINSNIVISLNMNNAILGANQLLTVYPSCNPDAPVDLVVTSSDPSVAAVRLVDRNNAPEQGFMSFTENGMALKMVEKLAIPGEEKTPSMASEKAIMIVGVQHGTATITVSTADGNVTPAVLELRVVDVNGDNVVTAADITALYDYLLNNDMTHYDTSDITGDGNITAADVTAVYDILLGNTPIYPPNPPVDVITEYTVGGVTFKMVRVEGGTFTMGATTEQGSEAGENENPAHQVTLSTFSIGETEVTQALWQAVMGNNPSNCNGGNYGTNLQRPVEWVTWDDCQQFITKLNQMSGKHFRLPTEAEWEYAARGGKKSNGYKYAGSNTVGDVAWHGINAGTQTVATKQPNELGLYDMSGNVWEWCQDWYDSYSSEAQTNPIGPSSGTSHVNRGGGWNASAKFCRVSWRGGSDIDHRGLNLGLRLAQ